ncbi:NAD(P)H-dependent oxidoreductase [Streptomyces cocklensis]|jgi:NAD(P)H-dependent FMN reductase|uniref:NADPH-dependent FMN reductase n=1 Tax=Actinacidiphila cocklensis TaxID=887465 RepID=A0A9W4DIX5_9ACTN|nr:NAD(P)H-dependent oxidoreductase [Actinacidiphila cocklensis]MDD1063727.1 NAD(P)H-dependent oxidoreductase [Actinacidiphila cocklensis]WSX72922.1 NAD(P)H-dependent oxidoreductase [Streptomyces sp. NBC_00899]WSX81010.1 NAD(P)H-dependent oxidoreductase [Streptomyces sp. NBC_00899]CAG6391055.1 NADPH-dependent FMN reductase [Actinacidiphila cocklensis]
MPDNPIKLALIIGSVRGGRFGPVVAKWFTEQARSHGEVEVEVIDLADYPLPLEMPPYGELPPPEVGAVWAKLSAKLTAADAFVMVTPEYNHAAPASLKNAIDWFKQEWVAKPVGIVSYGGVGGGLRAAENLRLILAELHAHTVRDTVSFHNSWGDFLKDGAVISPEGSDAAAKSLLDQVVWWGRALREAREKRPYLT